MYRICVVCHGNICRSPMAEYLLRVAFAEAGLGDQVRIDSAGTSAEEFGNRMDYRAEAALRRSGTPDLGWSGHRARQFNRGWFDQLDLVLAADLDHQRRLLALAATPEQQAKVRLVRSFDPRSVAAGTLRMADPWYGTDTDFDTTLAEITAAVPGIVSHVQAQLAES